MVLPDFIPSQNARRSLVSARPGAAFAVVALCLTAGLLAATQTSDEYENRCTDPTENAALRVGACSALIQSAQQNTSYLAVAYNNRGNGYKAIGEYDRAIQDFTQAIQLNPEYALAFYNRANAYDSIGEYERAIQDYNQAIRLRPNDASAYYAFYGRGYAFNAKGDYDHAVDDFNQAIRLHPDDANAFIVRGVANFLRQNIAHAVTDFERGSELNPSMAYDLLWLHFARKRLGQDDAKDFAKRSAKADLTRWPAPILKFYTGKLTAAQLIAAADESDDPDQQKSRRCEVNFFAGEQALLRHRDDTAKSLLQAALDGCPKTNLHYDAAGAELKRLNAVMAFSAAGPLNR